MSSKEFITSKKWQDLLTKLSHFDCFEESLKEEFMIASSKGGQKVNKSSSAVRLIYLKENKCFVSQRFRCQNQNRYDARKKLLCYLEDKYLGKNSPQSVLVAKKKKQKARRRRKTISKLGCIDTP